MKIAEGIAWRCGTEGTAVITGEGVRSYYHNRGYTDEDTFVVKKWLITRDRVFVILPLSLILIAYILLIIIIHV